MQSADLEKDKKAKKIRNKLGGAIAQLVTIFTAAIVAITFSQLVLAVLGILFIIWIARNAWRYVYKILKLYFIKER